MPWNLSKKNHYGIVYAVILLTSGHVNYTLIEVTSHTKRASNLLSHPRIIEAVCHIEAFNSPSYPGAMEAIYHQNTFIKDPRVHP